ncbi:MAG: mechanosensitive ion channel family protein [Lachnospiraceae bacterium]|nr:mechanosensitive ion channel family protein [Lachnospiraceae bacterium]
MTLIKGKAIKPKKNSDPVKVRDIFVSAIVLISFAVFVVLLWMNLLRSFQSSQIQNNLSFFSTTVSNLDKNDQEIVSLAEKFDSNNTIMLNDLAKVYSYDNYRKLESMPVKEQSELLLKSTSSMRYCSWIVIVNRDGDALMSDLAENVGINIVDGINLDINEFHELCDGNTEKIIIDNPYADVSEYPGSKLYLYCKAIPGSGRDGEDKYILISFVSDIIDETEARMNDLSVWMNESAIGNNGAVFMVDASSDVIKYGTLMGTDLEGSAVSGAGFDENVLSDGFNGTADINGVRCFVSTKAYSSQLYGLDNYIVAAVPVMEIYKDIAPVAIWNYCLFLIILTIIIAFAAHAGKILPVILAAAVLLFSLSFYFQLLMKLSESFSESMRIEEYISRNVEESASLQEEFRDYSNLQYESRARLMAFMIALNGSVYLDPDKEEESVNVFNEQDYGGKRDAVKDEYNNAVQVINNSKSLEELKKLNEVDEIYLISDAGSTMATSSAFWNFSLSTDPEDQSYEFWDIINGKSETVVQDVMMSDEGKMSQFIGCTLNYYTCLDDNGETKYVSYTNYLAQENGQYSGNEITHHMGLLQVEIDPTNGDQMIESAKPEYILANSRISNGGFLMGFINDEEMEDYKVFYSPKASMKDKYASELGIPKGAFSGNYNGFQTIDKTRYLQSFRQAADYFVATAIPLGSLYHVCFETALFCTVFVLIIMIIITLYMMITGDLHSPLQAKDKNENAGVQERPDSSRKFENVLKNGMIILGVLFLAAIIVEGKRYGSDSAFFYILSAEWDRGVHIFSISACFLIIIVSVIVMKILGYIACQIASAFGNSAVTMIRLISSLLKVVAVAVIAMYCLFLLGIDATRLLASAGIMSVVVGLGAQSLVGDLLAGIFIILEGSLHVGDYVMIDDVRGKVLEIGLRTTKFEDDNQNIRVICNNQIKTFANMSKKYSVVYYNIPVPYNEDYPRIRKILNDEFLTLYENNRFLKSIPVCQGIQNFDDSAVEMRVMFMCDESERFMVQRFMYDEIMRIFMENNIEIPFNQLDIHLDSNDKTGGNL